MRCSGAGLASGRTLRRRRKRGCRQSKRTLSHTHTHPLNSSRRCRSKRAHSPTHTHTLNSSRRGSMSENWRSSGSPPTLWCDLMVCECFWPLPGGGQDSMTSGYRVPCACEGGGGGAGEELGIGEACGRGGGRRWARTGGGAHDARARPHWTPTRPHTLAHAPAPGSEACGQAPPQECERTLRRRR